MKRRLQLGALALAMVIATAAGARLAAQGALTLTSPVFKDGDPLPTEYSADGKNVSPPLAWTGAPAATKEFALILDDPDANFAGRGPFVHWVLYKIPGTAKGVPEAVPMDVIPPALLQSVQPAPSLFIEQSKPGHSGT